jgi:sRNA-binding protein
LAAGLPLADSAAGDWLRRGGALASGFSVGEIDAALKAWCGRWDYQRAIVAGRMRVKLDGEDGGAITEPERDHALERLKALERRKSPAAGQPRGLASDDEDEKKGRKENDHESS